MKIKLLLIFLPLAILVGCSSSSCDDSKSTDQWHNCSGTYVEKGKGTYSGEWKHGEWNGKGEFESIQGNKYAGEFKNGKYTGTGTITFASGNKYVGESKGGKPHGHGTYVRTYPFKTQMKGGQVIYIFDWQGQVGQIRGHLEGTVIGQATQDYPAFWGYGKYVGGCKDGKKHGHGTQTYDKHDVLGGGGKYVGGWKDGEEHGHGTYTYSDGNKYDGEYKNGQRHGDGITTFGSDGTFRGIKVSKIIGEYKNDALNGIGLMIRDDGEWHYAGKFKDNKYHGHGTYFYYDVNNKDKFVGEWEGEWKNGKRNGHGTYTYSDGNKYDGVWKDDSFIYE